LENNTEQYKQYISELTNQQLYPKYYVFTKTFKQLQPRGGLHSVFGVLTLRLVMRGGVRSGRKVS